MFGCHNCENRPRKGAKYETTACANCRACEDPSIQAYYPIGHKTISSYQVMHPAYEDSPEELPEYLVIQNVLMAFSKTIGRLMEMRDRSPETFRVVEMKMKYPLNSYSQIARQLNCKKQNVQYHLKKAMKIYPELSFAFIIDPRRSGGQQIKKECQKIYEQLGLRNIR